MDLLTIFFIVAIGAAIMFIIWKWVPSPYKNPLLFVIAFALVVWFANMLGLFNWLKGQHVG